jgi:hypothetical protein
MMSKRSSGANSDVDDGIGNSDGGIGGLPHNDNGICTDDDGVGMYGAGRVMLSPTW